MATTQHLVAVTRAARTLLSEAAPDALLAGSVEDHAALVGELQALVNLATAVQDTAIASLAALETELAEDGTLVETRRVPGHVSPSTRPGRLRRAVPLRGARGAPGP
ncbi:MAG: hypothetical protein IE926_18485 [Micrococcales bacterium]|nr:hypothetical protein [Micrococcales bacterium]